MRCFRRNSFRGRLVVVAWAAGAAGGAASADEITPESAAAAAELTGAEEGQAAASLVLVQPAVNGVQYDVALMLRSGGCYYADAETLAAWRISPPYPSPVEHEGRQFFALDDFPGLSVTVAERDMTAVVTAPPELMLGTQRSFASPSGPVSPNNAFGAFLDYDVGYTDDDSGIYTGASGLLSPTVFTPLGSLSANALYQSDIELPEPVPQTLSMGWVRLDTAWTYDRPAAMTTLRVGDAITPSGSWARSVHFGGVQFGTNFATRPYEITFPQPSIRGTAAVPSAVDVLVNGVLQSRTDVPSGAFQLDNVPVVTGAGQIQVVTRDLLGREQVVTQDIYVSERLLRRGLNEFSINAGALRENFGYESNSYGDFLLAGVLRRGMSDVLTIEGRIDATSEVSSVGATVARAMGRYGVASIALAVSNGTETGTLIQVGHDFQGRVYRGNIRVQSSRDFEQPGMSALAATVALAESGAVADTRGLGSVVRLAAWPELQVIASGGRNFGRKGSLGLTYVGERFAEGLSDRRIFTLSYSRTLTRRLALSASASYFGAEDDGGAANVIVSRTLGRRSSVSSSLNTAYDTTSMRVDHRYELPVGPGFGYRTSLLAGDLHAVEAEVDANTAHARYSAEMAQRDGASGWRMQTRGSVAVLGGEVFAAREISDGFAVVDAAGFENVRVYLENREVGVTNANGHLLVPRLRPYENNQLRIETADLPLNVRVDNDALRIAPYYRSGAVASFGIEASASAILRVILPDRSPVPEGSKAAIGAAAWPVGIDGRLYLENVRAGARVEIAYGGARCALTLPEIPVTDAIPDLGERVCRPIAP
jgi:outer membrane usher protein